MIYLLCYLAFGLVLAIAISGAVPPDERASLWTIVLFGPALLVFLAVDSLFAAIAGRK